ncbi:hypothetical protein B0H13DRAFT_2369844 [Mycena leptocephala]|nr:hypothetical protein B0H13DRAFT_2369844 [Mycena leptocephala]
MRLTLLIAHPPRPIAAFAPAVSQARPLSRPRPRTRCDAAARCGTRMCLALRDANINVQALSYGPRSAGAMWTPPWLPHDDKNTPARRKGSARRPRRCECPCATPRDAKARRAPNSFYTGPLTSFLRLAAMVFTVYYRYSVHNVASRPLEEALAASTSGLLQQRTS